MVNIGPDSRLTFQKKSGARFYNLGDWEIPPGGSEPPDFCHERIVHRPYHHSGSRYCIEIGSKDTDNVSSCILFDFLRERHFRNGIC